MRRPTRTRRLSIAAMVSLLAAVAVGTVEVRSFWNYDGWHNGKGQELALDEGCACFSSSSAPFYRRGHERGTMQPDSSSISEGIWGFELHHGTSADALFDGRTTEFSLPLWPLVLLLLIAPLCWLRAPPPNAPAFPVVVKQSYVSNALPATVDQKPTHKWHKWIEGMPLWFFLLVCVIVLVMISIGLRWLVALSV